MTATQTDAHLKFLGALQGGESSIWRHLAVIAVLGRSPMRPKIAIAVRWRQIEPSLLKLSGLDKTRLMLHLF